MTKNPFLNSLSATAYIILVALVMQWGSNQVGDEPDTFLAPVAFISVFTLSAAVMGYLFFYNPVMMYLDGKKKAAVTLFLKTLGTFAVTTALLLILVFGNLIRI